jgi:hypothetical protein
MSERQDAPVGICVSGGGLRAASFGLGALQALHEDRGLLRGEQAADYLSAVSGGSYVAGAFTLVNCSDAFDGAAPPARTTAGQLPPLAPGSPESEHLRRHCRYMIEEGGVRTSTRMFVLGLLNLAAVASLVFWFGIMVGDFATAGSYFLPSEIDEADGTQWLQWVLAVAALGVLWWLVHSVGRGPSTQDTTPTGLQRVLGMSRRLFLVIAGTATLLVGGAALATRITEVPIVASPSWLVDHVLPVAIVVGALALATALVNVASRRVRRGAPLLQRLSRAGVAVLTLGTVQAVGVLLVAWAAAWMYTVYNGSDSAWPIAVFFGALLAPLLLQPFIDRSSPHHAYRDLLIRCFSVIRGADGRARAPSDPRGVLLSQLRPPEPGGSDSFPELLICAAANVSDVGATPAGTNVLSLVLTPHEITIPAAGVSTPIEHLERYRRPTALVSGLGPAITLPAAVAMTGAAVSPAMGKRTRKHLRALFAILNIRLGVWLPNILRDDVRSEAAAVIDGDRGPRVSVGIDEMIQELFGLHSSTARKLYVSDGGHYDNLGLVELLRRRCRTIWCIDASGDVPGRATALSEAILVASGDLGARVKIDLDRFALASDVKLKDAILENTHAVGTVRYSDGAEGTIVVVKLGLSEDSPDNLHEHRRTDRAFPHHSTLNQVFRADRFDAYRALGWDSASRALADEEVVARTTSPGDDDLAA